MSFHLLFLFVTQDERAGCHIERIGDVIMNVFRSRLTRLLAVGLVLGFVIACGGQAEPTATAEPSPLLEPTVTASPTPEPTASPTPEPTATAMVDATANFTEFESPDGGFSLRYPDGWFTTQLFGFAIVASNQALLDSPDAGEDGGVVLAIGGSTADFESDDPVEVVNRAVTDFDLGEDAEITEGPDATTINGQDAAVARISAMSDNGVPLSAYVAAVINGERGTILIAATPVETEAEFMPIFEAMARTIEVSEPTITATPAASLLETEGFLLYGDSVTGSVTESGPSTWEFIGLEGEVVDVIVEPLDDSLDVVVNVLDESGTSILESGEVDESFGIEEIRALTIPAPGTFYLTIAGFGGSVGEYRIILTETGATATDGDNMIAYGDRVTGVVAAAGEMTTWRFSGSEGDVVALAVEPAGDFDAVLDLQDVSGTSILIGEERDYSFDAEYAIVSLPDDGEYIIVIKGFEDSSGDYELAVTGPGGSIVSAGDTLEEGDNEAGHAFPFTASAGEVVGIVVEPEGELDVVIEIQDGNGESMRTRPFDASFGTESFAFGIPEDGNYSFYVKGFEGGLGAYEVTLLGSDRTIFELAYNDVVSGRTGADGLIEYAVNGLAGDIMTVAVEPDSATDVTVEVRDLEDNVLVEVDDAIAGEVEELSYTFGEEGFVIIRVRDFFENAGDFVLTITAVTGD